MTSYLPSAITQPLARGTDLLRGALGGVSWGPGLAVSKAAVTAMLSRIEIGQLIITDETTGQITIYGQKIAKEHSKMSNGVNGVNGIKKVGGVRKVEWVVKRETFWMRLFLFADMGFAESYMLGDFECSDLTGFFEVWHCFRILVKFVLTWIALHPQSQPIG
jgi:cyclopropane-fatty-acyl-phospholipid synthase